MFLLTVKFLNPTHNKFLFHIPPDTKVGLVTGYIPLIPLNPFPIPSDTKVGLVTDYIPFNIMFLTFPLPPDTKVGLVSGYIPS